MVPQRGVSSVCASTSCLESSIKPFRPRKHPRGPDFGACFSRTFLHISCLSRALLSPEFLCPPLLQVQALSGTSSAAKVCANTREPG